MVRGIERRDIFNTDEDREDLLCRLATLVPATGTCVYAWSLLKNHFHLLLRSGEAGLSAFMRRLQTGYAVSFNRRHRRAGHLFQNRYKSVLVEEEPYFLELVRYIHLNPVRAGVIKSLRGLDAYPWSGHAAILGNRGNRGNQEAPWQDVDFVLVQFGSRRARARQAYRRYVADGIRQGRRPELSGGGLARSVGGREKLEELRRGRERWASDERILGSSEFVLGIEEEQEKGRGEGPGRIRVAPEDREKFLERLQSRIGRIFKVAPAELRGGSRRRVAVVARAALGWVAVRVCGLPTSDVARASGVSPVSILRSQERGREALDKRGVDAERLARKCKQ
jgi:REP element-mobilizing transposase RayT